MIFNIFKTRHLPTTHVVTLTVALYFVVQDYEHHKWVGLNMLYTPPGGKFTLIGKFRMTINHHHLPWEFGGYPTFKHTPMVKWCKICYDFMLGLARSTEFVCDSLTFIYKLYTYIYIYIYHIYIIYIYHIYICVFSPMCHALGKINIDVHWRVCDLLILIYQ